MKTPLYVIANLCCACWESYSTGGREYFWHNLSCELRRFGPYNGPRDWADEFLFGLGATLMGKRFPLLRLEHDILRSLHWDRYDEQYLSSWFPSVRRAYKARKAALSQS